MATMQDVLKSYNEQDGYRFIVSVSGGKDSAALAIYLKQKYPELPFEYLFSDTECELPETEAYLTKLEALLGVEVKRISAKKFLNIGDKPGRNSFDIILNELYGGFLPSPRSRWCTGTLKIKPFEMEIGDSFAYSFIGIRGDENREGYIPKKTHIITDSANDILKADSPRKKPPVISHKQNIIPIYPFKEEGLGLEDIKEILEDAGIGLPEYYSWRSRSGCYFCFYQQIGEWQGLLEHHPELYKKAMEYENPQKQDRLNKGKKRFTWVEGKTLEEIAQLKERYEIADMDETEGCAICHL